MSLQVWLPLNGNIENNGLLGNFTQGTAPSYTSEGKIGKALTTGSLVMSAEQTASVLNNNEVSFCFWVYPNADTGAGGGQLFGTDSMGANNNRKFAIFLYPTVNDIHLSWQNDSVDNPFIASVYSGAMPSYKWTHIAITYKNPTCTLYINGEKKATYTGVSSSSSFAYQTQLLHNATYRRLNDFRIYNHCLSSKEIKEISKGLLCHYKLDNKGFGNPNLITTMSSGGRTTLNGKYGLNADFSQNTDTYGYFNVSPALELDSTYTLSFDVSNFPVGGAWNFKLWNNANYDVGTITKDGHYTYTFVPSESKLPSDYNLTKFLFDDGGRTNPVGMVYFTNFKIEKGNKPTSWCPHTSDSLYTSLGLNSTIESDCSGYKNDGNKIGNVLPSSESGRYSTSTYCNSTNIGTSTPTGAAFIKCSLVSPIINATTLTINWWGNIEDYSYQDSGILSLSNDPSYPSDYMTSALAQYDSTFRFNLTDGNYSSISSISLIDTGSWHMYTLVFNNGIVQGYRDGVSIISNSKSGTLAQFSYIYMGINVAGGAYRQTKSKWSDFRIYSTALSASDIKELYNVSASIDKNGNMYAYEFKEE